VLPTADIKVQITHEVNPNTARLVTDIH